MWQDKRLLDLFGIELPIVQAPMAGANGSAMAAAVGLAGGLGSLPCATLDAEKIRSEVGVFRQLTSAPINLNFFCHAMPGPNEEAQARWRNRLGPYYDELGLPRDAETSAVTRQPFGEDQCALIEELAPEIVSFHFGLPSSDLVDRVRKTGATVISSATTVAEAKWLEKHGCDAIIAQGYEAGGHRGMFLTDDLATQVGTMALVPQVVDAVSVPVIAAGGIADGRGIAAAMMLGAAGVQIGTAYLSTPEATISDLHRLALAAARDDETALTNIFSGRPARGLMNRVMREVGPMAEEAPPFPTAGAALAPIKSAAEAQGDSGFSQLWSGQAARLAMPAPSGELTCRLAEDALGRLSSLSSSL